MTSLWKWMTALNLTINLPDMDITPPYENDFSILDAFIHHGRSKLCPEAAAALVRLVRGSDETAPPQVAALRANTAKLQQHLHSNNIVWASDMTNAKTSTRSRGTGTNRTIRRQYHYMYTSMQSAWWVGEYLSGIPGIFTLALECDFALGPRAVRGVTNYSAKEEFDYFHWEHSDALTNTVSTEEAEAQLLSYHAESGTPVNSATDGSVWKGTGTYAYMFFTENLDKSDVFGGGREDSMPVLAQCATEMMARKISSTRMEAYGILALHAAGKYMDNEHLLEFLNGCDSKAAIQ
jgi:hypothetical protein